MLKNKKKKKKGFTLIELVIVLAVLAIIALIAIPNFTKVRQDSMIKADQRTGDVIKRVTLTKIAEQKIKVGTNGGTIIVTPNEDPTQTVVTSTSDITFSAADSANNIDAGDDDMVKDLREVKPPQVKGQTKFIVTIDSNENVTKVETAA